MTNAKAHPTSVLDIHTPTASFSIAHSCESKVLRCVCVNMLILGLFCSVFAHWVAIVLVLVRTVGCYLTCADFPMYHWMFMPSYFITPMTPPAGLPTLPPPG